MDHKEMWLKDVNWFQLAEDMSWWLTHVHGNEPLFHKR
jgi:hypothetical protein